MNLDAIIQVFKSHFFNRKRTIMKNQDYKILQIIPADERWVAIARNPDEIEIPLVCWALLQNPDGSTCIKGMVNGQDKDGYWGNIIPADSEEIDFLNYNPVYRYKK